MEARHVKENAERAAAAAPNNDSSTVLESRSQLPRRATQGLADGLSATMEYAGEFKQPGEIVFADGSEN